MACQRLQCSFWQFLIKDEKGLKEQKSPEALKILFSPSPTGGKKGGKLGKRKEKTRKECKREGKEEKE